MLRMNYVLLLEICLWLIIFSHLSISCTSYVIFGDKHLKLHCRWLQLYKRVINTLLLKNKNINNLCWSGVSGVNEWAWTLAKCRKRRSMRGPERSKLSAINNSTKDISFVSTWRNPNKNTCCWLNVFYFFYKIGIS